jgi:hypothetical protein
MCCWDSSVWCTRRTSRWRPRPEVKVDIRVKPCCCCCWCCCLNNKSVSSGKPCVGTRTVSARIRRATTSVTMRFPLHKRDRLCSLFLCQCSLLLLPPTPQTSWFRLLLLGSSSSSGMEHMEKPWAMSFGVGHLLLRFSPWHPAWHPSEYAASATASTNSLLEHSSNGENFFSVETQAFVYRGHAIVSWTRES